METDQEGIALLWEVAKMVRDQTGPERDCVPLENFEDQARRIIWVVVEAAIDQCRKQQEVYLDHGYAGPNPANSMSERLACRVCADRIDHLRV